ncbi:MAG TPA: tetratricopeptide repeat protein [Candidatus Anoxymicrobiaceae bacterium]
MAAIPAAPGQKNTLKWAIIGVVSLLVVAAIVLVVVFVALGSDTGKAKELARKGDVYMNKATATGKNVATSVNDLMTNFKTVSSASDYESMADSIRTDTKSATSDLGSAQKEYKQILDLSGVDKYKDYARARLAQIDVDFKQVRAVDDYLDYLSRQFSDAEAGATIDSAAIAVTTATFFSGLEEASTEAGKLKDKADNLQKDLQL